MFKRFPYLPLILAIAIAAVVAAPAMATDEVVAPPVPVAPGQAVPPPSGVPCTDTAKPTSKISTKSARVTRTRVVRGTASDRGCGASGAGAVARVEISVQRKSGSKCKYMTSRGRLGAKKSCATHSWLTAHGTSSWAFSLPKRLADGNYEIRVRSRDSAGNVGSQHKRPVKLK